MEICYVRDICNDGLPNGFDPNSTNTSIRVLQKDLERLRGVVGNNDAHRIRVICQRIDKSEFDMYEDVGVSNDKVRINEQDKEFVTSLPGEWHAQQFHNLVREVEERNDVDLRESNNVVP